MSTFQHTLEKSQIWLGTLKSRLGLSTDEDAYRLFKIVLHEIRDRLPLNEAVQLGAQLPMLIRGLYYEGFSTSGSGTRDKSLHALLTSVENKLPRLSAKNTNQLVRGVLQLLTDFISEGEIHDVRSCCPEDLRVFWPSAVPPKKSA
ncbi:MAG: DUF2267 domain-containing protein [Proteobacteria bacterium]|nr:DUF2267 domain-containing protein [Pseudomonadota bacterium]